MMNTIASIGLALGLAFSTAVLPSHGLAQTRVPGAPGKPAQVRVAVECKAYDRSCTEKIRAALVKATGNTKYAEWLLSEVKKGHQQGAKSRAAKERSFVHDFSGPPAALGVPVPPHTHQISFSWGEVIGFLFFIMP